ncbi:phosphoribosylamine--glycine ligase [Thermosulfidibacter takaii ABI70S6]|uniref:Phosphoribosylamine--glycine ligase n=1 Tax=Thermosulfidibacter takaii (strain DSM 17441 / JCM 13301 / NBRC 103674 / ABI70S6) TaxID=1298851 RepID=A0A0S3QVH0_THET7|nr:phosphoribosylamine--glycine ligase [Thermosulfidibacter takaii]BAT72324.1 phosphoribosylamine--glycine ligase [Thermosulfidibacter takaii ABI70S6]
MKVLVVGGGGREHALVWKLAQSDRVEKVYAAPGNAGIEGEPKAQCIDISPSDLEVLRDFALKENIDLTVVGPEDPLVHGIVDLFEEAGLTIFGPRKDAAILEGSKAFAKNFMKEMGIPTADFEVFDDPQKAKRYIKDKGAPIVVKADGLCAGKGSIVCKTVEEALEAVDKIMVERIFGDAGNKVVIEEFMKGEEASFIVITDGEHVVPLASSQDHKPVFDNDEGPNTGGMGAYSPAPVVTPEIHEKAMKEIVIPTIKGMKERGVPFKGVLYVGLMIIDDKYPKVLEYNVRFGDPEAQPILMRMESDLVDAIEASISGNLDKCDIRYTDEAAVCVVMASGGYPGKYEKGKVIHGLEEVEKMEKVKVFHAGTKRVNGKIVTNGGRVLGVTALGKIIKEAIDRAYEAVSKIHWENVHYRKDIGAKALRRLGLL